MANRPLKTCFMVATMASGCGIVGMIKSDSPGLFLQVDQLEEPLWHIAH